MCRERERIQIDPKLWQAFLEHHHHNGNWVEYSMLKWISVIFV
jgi:hypothetical protein